MAGPLTFRRWLLALSLYALLALATLTVAPLLGSTHVDVREGIRQIVSGEANGQEARILLDLRLPRVTLAFLAGGALALAGAGFQVILRNPLAEPFTLGVTGGASVGAVAAICLSSLAAKLTPWLPGAAAFLSRLDDPAGPLFLVRLTLVQAFALGGAAAALGLVYRLARRPHGISMNTLLLAGVTISILSGGLVMFITTLARPFELMSMQRWLMGGVDVTGFRSMAMLPPLLLPGLAILMLQAPALSHLSLGEEMAAGHGVDVAAVQKMTFLGGGLVTAAVISITGPIGFVGLIVPHMVRRLSGFDQRLVLPAAFLLGGALLAACDTAGRVIFAPQEMPVGVLTALIGGPIFIRILLGRRR